MRLFTQTVGVLCAAELASAIACPFGAAAEAGLLSDADLAKYKAVKRDGIASESFSVMQKKAVTPDTRNAVSGRASNGLLPITLPGSGLSLGGGLRELIASSSVVGPSLTFPKSTEFYSHLLAGCLFLYRLLRRLILSKPSQATMRPTSMWHLDIPTNAVFALG